MVAISNAVTGSPAPRWWTSAPWSVCGRGWLRPGRQSRRRGAGFAGRCGVGGGRGPLGGAGVGGGPARGGGPAAGARRVVAAEGRGGETADAGRRLEVGAGVDE